MTLHSTAVIHSSFCFPRANWGMYHKIKLFGMITSHDCGCSILPNYITRALYLEASRHRVMFAFLVFLSAVLELTWPTCLCICCPVCSLLYSLKKIIGEHDTRRWSSSIRWDSNTWWQFKSKILVVRSSPCRLVALCSSSVVVLSYWSLSVYCCSCQICNNILTWTQTQHVKAFMHHYCLSMPCRHTL